MNKKLLLRALPFLLACLWLIRGAAVAQESNNGGADNSMSTNRGSQPSGAFSPVNGNANTGVDLYTGRLQASLPIFTLSSSDLKIPIALDYTSGGGVRPSDQNSIVGLGWALIAGGSISREVRGLPDEATNGYIGNASNTLTTNNVGTLAVSTFNSPGSAVANFDNVNNSTSSKALLDGEPDVFFIQTPSFSARFVFDQNGNAVFQNATGITVAHSLYKNSANASNTGIVVTDDKGNQYFFGSDSTSREQTSTSFFGTAYRFVSTWYLSKIVLYNGKDVVNFNYVSGTAYTVQGVQGSKDFETGFNPYTGFPPTSPTGQFSGENVRVGLFSYTSFTPPKYLSSIVTKLGEADFSYTANANTNLNGANPWELTTVTIKQLNPVLSSPNDIIRTYTLNYSEVESGINNGWPAPIPGPVLIDQYRRLLSSITLAGNTAATATPITLFTLKYNQSASMPDRGLFQNVDYWGYANNLTFEPDVSGEDDDWFELPDIEREPSYYTVSTLSLYASLLAVNEIDSYQGDVVTMSYEPNSYYTPNPPIDLGSATNVIVGGMRVTGIQHTVSGNLTSRTTYNYNDVNGNSTGQLYNGFYRLVSMFFGNSANNYLGHGADNIPTLSMSQSPYSYADDKGVFVGYSSVRTTNQDGGYEVDNFTNFSDYPDNITTPPLYYQTATNATWNATIGSIIQSVSYKRGLVKNRIQYTSGGAKVSETDNTYGTIGPAATVSEVGLQDGTWFLNGNGTGNALYLVNVYNCYVENFRLTQATHYDYDQANPANSIVNTANYTYCADNRLISTISTTDSRNNPHVQSFYHANDASIPMVTTTEQTALSSMVGSNRTNVQVHTIDNKNGTLQQVHNSYSQLYSGANFVLPTTVTSYASYPGATSPTITRQQTMSYDLPSGNLISSSERNGMAISYLYGYNGAYPVAKVTNAANTLSVSNTSTTTTSYLTFNAGQTGEQGATFTTAYAGTITITLPPGSYLAGPSVTVFMSIGLTGPVNGSGTLCESSAGGCGTTTNTVSFANMPAGTYSLLALAETNTGTSTVSVSYTYPSIQTVSTRLTEFFYDGFEQDGNVFTSAHTGTGSYSGSYTVPFTLPNSRSYLLDWWSLSGGVWTFNEQAYTGPVTLTGQIDDVRVFPTDAMMETTTFSPMIGKSADTDPGGHSTFYQYDGLGRASLVLDNDLNIIKAYSYTYQAPVLTTYAVPYTNQTAVNWAVTATSSNGIVTNFTLGTSGTLTLPAGVYSLSFSSGGQSTSVPPVFLVNGVSFTATGTTNIVANFSNVAVGVGNPGLSINISTPFSLSIVNRTTYPANIVAVTIDGVVHEMPAPGQTVVFPIASGNHNLVLAFGPSSNYLINGVNYNASQTSGGGITYPVSGNVVIDYVQAPLTSLTVNLTTDATSTNACSCFGCQYTHNVFYFGTTVGQGTQLYSDNMGTIPLSGYTWLMNYATDIVYPLSGSGVLTTAGTACH